MRNRRKPLPGVVPVEHRHLWFGTPDRPLSGWLSLPKDHYVEGAALLCPPVGDESRAAHRTFRRLAESLAEGRLVTLRFDVDGIGDSAGSLEDPEPAKRWLGSVELAREELRRLGFPEVAAVGMRMGGTLAATVAANDDDPFSALVLWDPCSSGSSFLREGEALYAFGDRSQPVQRDLVHTPGYAYDDAAVASLRTLNLGRLPAGRLAERVLLLSRLDRPLLDSARARLDQELDRIQVEEAIGQPSLLDVPPSNAIVPERSLARVVEWVLGGFDAVAGDRVVLPADREVVLGGAVGTATRHTITEHSLWLADGQVYGMATEPVPAPVPGVVRPWVVLINVATTDHTGPGRAWVEWARQWASMGLRCVRIDLTGTGDSPARPGRAEDHIYDPIWLVDVRKAVAELSGDGARVCVVGLCSGAYSGFEAAATGAVDAMIGINPTLTLYPAARGGPVHSRDRRVARLPLRPLGKLAVHRRIAAGAMWRTYRQFAVWHAPAVPVRRLARRGTGMLLLGNPKDMLQFREVVWWTLVGLVVPRRGIRFVIDSAIDHPMLTRAGKQTVFAHATAYLRERYPEAVSDADPGIGP